MWHHGSVHSCLHPLLTRYPTRLAEYQTSQYFLLLICLVRVSFLENSALATFLSRTPCYGDNAHAACGLKVPAVHSVNEMHARLTIIVWAQNMPQRVQTFLEVHAWPDFQCFCWHSTSPAVRVNLLRPPLVSELMSKIVLPRFYEACLSWAASSSSSLLCKGQRRSAGLATVSTECLYRWKGSQHWLKKDYTACLMYSRTGYNEQECAKHSLIHHIN